MLLAPSWGGMLNGLLTLRGAWDRVRESPVLKFFVVAVTAYGMSTFEGPMLSLKNVNAISHYTDWTVAHVHVGALGWNGFMTFGMLYYLVPIMWKTKLYSTKLANWHFWIGTLGILFYALPMYWAGFAQSLMWKEFDADGFLAYPNFLETVTQIIPMYVMRTVGGTMYLIGTLIMTYNLLKTAGKGIFQKEVYAEAPALQKNVKIKGGHWHAVLERKPVVFTLLAFVAVVIGGVVEFVPTWVVDSNIPTIASVKPYTPLELEGRDIYIREGCNNCHSQMIRPFRSETERYGEYTKAGELVYDHPHLFGSKRTGPDLQREGGKYPNSWHYNHMLEPTSMSPGSIMPAYPWLFDDEYDTEMIGKKLSAMQTLGVPYSDKEIASGVDDMLLQATQISNNLAVNDIEVSERKEIVPLIAYLQRLGIDIKVNR